MNTVYLLEIVDCEPRVFRNSETAFETAKARMILWGYEEDSPEMKAMENTLDCAYSDGSFWYEDLIQCRPVEFFDY